MIRHTYIFFIKIISIDKYSGLQMKDALADWKHVVDAANVVTSLGYRLGFHQTNTVNITTNKYNKHN